MFLGGVWISVVDYKRMCNNCRTIIIYNNGKCGDYRRSVKNEDKFCEVMLVWFHFVDEM